MKETPAVLNLWGAVLMQNKLIDTQKWDEALAAHRKAEGQISIGLILIEKRFLSAKGVDVVSKKVAEVIAKKTAASAVKAAATPTPPPVASALSSKPAPVRPAATPPPPPPPAAAPPHPAAAAAPTAPATEDTGEIALDDAGTQPAEHWKASDADWVESSAEQTTTGPGPATAVDAIEEIPLVGDDSLTAPLSGPSKIVVDNRPQIKSLAPTKTKAAAAQRKTPVGEAGHDEEARIVSPVAPNDMDPDALSYFRRAVEMGASDLHLASGSPPFVRLNGTLTFLENTQKLTPERAQRMVLGFMDDSQQQRYLRHHDVDFAFEHPELGRSRVNALEQFRGPDIIFRLIPAKVPSLADLGLPATLAKFTEWHQGLVLVTGPAGCGKSTTAAALIDLVNSHRKDHIIAVEDPIEFLHHSKGCNVTQRQVITHTKSFATALKAALREDPDVIMIGEMRDLETVSLAIRAAETGHLVIGTLQTKSAARTIDRVIDVFPADQQAQIRTMLSESLRGVISQQLIPRADGKGRVVALEILHVTGAVANLIRDSKTFQLQSQMQTGRKLGQRLMDDSLEELYNQGIITREDAAKAAENPKRFRKEDAAGKK